MISVTPKIVKVENSQLFPVAISLALLILNLPATAAPSAVHTECVAEVAAFSAACLRWLSVSTPSNNFTAAVSQQCCDAITFPLNSSESSFLCLCHILKQPEILGLDLNLSRVLLLPSVCLGNTTRSLELLSMCSSVEFSEKSVSEHEEASPKCNIPINGNCTEDRCCKDLCDRQIRYAKTVTASHISGTNRCLCHVMYNGKPGPCAP